MKNRKIKLKCIICGKIFYRSPSHVKSKNVFCSRKHKEKGMILGLVAPMRLGTGYGVKDILTRRKYYKYRQYDKDRSLNTVNKPVREFVKEINESKCIYCGNKEKLGYDRINNKQGHTEKNIVICCELCNMTRGDRFTVTQMKKIGKIIASFKLEKGVVGYGGV